MNLRQSWILVLFLSMISCGDPHPKNDEPSPPSTNDNSQPVVNPAPPASDVHTFDVRPDESTSTPRVHSYSQSSNEDCGIADGTYNSIVYYNNPKTGFSNSYTLDVVVDNCEVIEIDFPKGGWLDSDHIDPTEISDDGTAEVEDDQGRTFEVHIDKDNIDSENGRDDDNMKEDESNKDEPDNPDKPEDSEDPN